ILADTGDLPGAISELSVAIKEDPTSAATHYYLGVFLQRRGDLKAASEEFEKATELNHAYREAFLGLGSALRKLGWESDAQAAFLEAQRLQRTVAQEQAARDAYNSACDLWTQGKVEEAV